MKQEPTINQLAERIGKIADETIGADQETRDNNYRLIRELARVIQEKSEQTANGKVYLQVFGHNGEARSKPHELTLASSNE